MGWRQMVSAPGSRVQLDLHPMTAAECLRSFMAAVNDGRRGDFGKAKELVERVRGKHGDGSAEMAKNEIWKYVQSDKKAQ
jgi:hypothetical protein